MKKTSLFAAAFLWFGLSACAAEVPAAPAPSVAMASVPTSPAPVEAPTVVKPELDASFAAAAETCPAYAQKCCGFLRNGKCVGNCVATNAQCP